MSLCPAQDAESIHPVGPTGPVVSVSNMSIIGVLASLGTFLHTARCVAWFPVLLCPNLGNHSANVP